MAIATEQLEAINQEITQAFSSDPLITVVPAEGTPPDTYEITYKIEGLQKIDGGDVEKTDSHTISISIPFGFPHFPPSCKPKSPVFHPDFDPAAICIGDFWEKNRSIVDLISHIGEMIAGKLYSTSNAFNEEAARWYTENFDQPGEQPEPEVAGETEQPSSDPGILQGDDITSLLEDDDTDVVEEDLLGEYEPADDDNFEPALSFVDEPEGRDEDVGDETLNDIFQESDFDFEASPQIDDDSQEEIPPPGFTGELEKEDREDGVDREHLQELVDQQRFFGLDKELSLLSADISFEGKEALAEQAAIAIEKAQAVYTRALEFEHKGEPEKALKCFKQIEGFTADYPGLQEDVSRMTQAIELLGDWATPAPEEREETIAPTLESEPERKPDAAPSQPPPPQTKKTEKKTEKEPESRTFFEDDTPPQKSRLIPIAIVVIVILIGAAAGINYYFSTSKYEQANKRFTACQASLNKNQFTDAEQQCESAIGLARQIKLFKSSERDLLIGNIERTLRSEPLKQGIEGNLPLDGQYFPRQVVQNIQTFRKFQKQGDDLFAAASWQHAVSNYKQAIEIAEKEEAIDRQQVFEISENIKIAEFRITYESALSYIARKKWILATNDFNKALEQQKTLALTDKVEIIDDITNRLSEIAQATEKEKGDAAFQESRWDDASTHYRKALATAVKAPNQDENTIFELKQLVVKGDLYSIISTGKSAFRQAQWDKAIASYDQAITLLEDNRELLQQANTDENRKKLARIMLQASVIRDKQGAARHLKEHEYSDAIEKLQAIIDSVSTSDFTEEQVFVAALDEARRSIEQAQTDRLLSDKISYLEDNFEELFTKHYSGSPPESLTERTVVFEKQEGDLLLFRLQCMEIGHGRPLQLVMKYAHDLKTDTWRFYSDPN